ncbi:hypothetical protein ABZ620_07570 [Nocardiopsis alba]|uniref:hypothetical protein n=1 Tax=Nocardiopsis alba TaxID=53437 RepID=UPI0033C8AB6A
MSTDELEVNVDDAHSGGTASEEAAAQLRDLPADFEDLALGVGERMSKAPGVENWDVFSEAHSSHMEKVKEHALTLAGNIQSGAEEVSSTDAESEDVYNSTDMPMRPVNHTGPLPQQ